MIILDHYFPTPGRDYLQEILSCVECALPGWDVKHASIWGELVQPSALNQTTVEVEDIEEVTQDAIYQELRSKISILRKKSNK